MAAKKSAMGAAKQKAQRDREHAAFLAKKGVKRTTFRDPITNRMVPIGTIPGRIRGD
jgi:hypothetical protein